MQKQTWFNKRKDEGEINNQPSMTQEGQAHTIQEIVNRYQNGIPIALDTRLDWAEDDDNIQFTFKDLTDIDLAKDLVKNVQNKLAEKRQQETETTTAEVVEETNVSEADE